MKAPAEVIAQSPRKPQKSAQLNQSQRKSTIVLHSEVSSDGDYMMKHPDLPIEAPPKDDYNQEEFL